MSSLSVSTKFIEIEENKMGTIIMKNIKTGQSAATYPILFKVKTNVKDKVDVRPSFGVLLPYSQRSTMTLNIKYLGQVQQIEKTKLLISWISTPTKKELEDKLSHQDFIDIFTKSSKVNQGSLILPFKFKENAQEDRFQENKSENVSSNNIQKSSDPFPPIADQKKIEKQKQNQQFSQKNLPKLPSAQNKSKEINDQQSSQRKIKDRSGFSLKLLILIFIVAFSLGFLLGIKIEEIKELLKSSPAQQSDKIIINSDPFVSEIEQNKTQVETQTPNVTQQIEAQTKLQKTQENSIKQIQIQANQQDNSQNEEEQNLDI